jgi:hypothetical protein
MAVQQDDFFSDIESIQKQPQAPPQQEQQNDFFSDLEALQQQQPQSKAIPFPQQSAKQAVQQPQATQALPDSVQSQNGDFFADLEQLQAQPQPQQSQAPDFLSDLEKLKAPEKGLYFVPKQKEPTKKQSNLLDQFKRGLKESASGEIQQQIFKPETQQELESDPSFWESLVKESGTISGDLPYMAAGATVFGALGSSFGPIGTTVGGAFGATALPAFLKESLKQYREYQESGKEDLTFGEFLQKADKVANRTLNEGLFGVILGSVKKAIPLLENTPMGGMFKSKIAQTAATVTAEAGVATAVPAIAQGRVPEAKDFAHALALFAGFNLAHLPSEMRERINREGKQSGLSPKEFAHTYTEEELARLNSAVKRGMPEGAEAKAQPKAEAHTFKTEKGSTYQLNEDGTTTRTKAARPEHPNDSGLQPKSEKTWFVTPEEANLLGEVQTSGHKKRLVELPDGRIGVEYIDGPDAGKVEQRTIVKPKSAPEKGMIPIETFKDDRVHFGNKITDVKALPSKPVELPKGAVLTKPEHIKTGMSGGKSRATISVEGEEGGLFPHEIELTPEEKQLIDGANIWDKAGDHKEAAKLAQQAREMIFARIKAQPAKLEVKSPKSRSNNISAIIPPAQQRFLPKSPEKPAEALEAAEARKAAPQGKTLDESVSFEAQKVESDKTKGMGFRQAIVDELHPLRAYVEANKATEEVPFSKDPYKMARLFKGWQGKAQVFLEHKTFDPDSLEFTGKGFREIIKPFKKDLPGLSKYLVAKRAIELERQNKQTGVDLADARSYVKANESKYENARKELRDYQNSLLDYAEESGLISKDTKHLWQDLNENYVPLQRVLEGPDDAYFNTKTMQPKQAFYKLEGSKRNIIDPLESIIGNTYKIIEASEKNRVVRSLVEFEKIKKGAEDANSFIEVKELGSEEPTLKNFSDYLRGKDIVEGNKVKYFDNGKLKTIEVNQEVADVLKGNFGPREMTYLGNLLQYPTRWIRTGAIALNPSKLAQLALQDQFEAYVYSEVGYKPAYDLVRGIFHSVKKGDLYNKWRAAGGDQSLQMDMSRSRKQETLKKVAGIRHVARSVDDVMRFIEEAFKPLETGTRVSLFERSLKRNGESPDALREAAFLARTTTLDYAVKGAKTKTLIQTIPFFNAAVQGIDKFVQEAKRNPKGVTIKGAAFLSVPTTMLWLFNNTYYKKDYEEIPQFEKDAFWNFFVDVPGMDKPLRIKIPKPHELGFVFGSVPEHILDYIDKNDPKAIKDLGKTFLDNFTPPFLPAVVRTGFEQYANKNILTGRAIIPQRLQKLPPEEQVQPYTSETAKTVGRLLQEIPYVESGASPIMVDHWISSLTGGAGSRLLKYTERRLEKAGVLKEKVRPEEELADVPFIGAFFGRNAGQNSASITRFYDESDKLEKQYNAIRLGTKEGREIESEDREAIVSKHKKSQKIRQAFAKQRKIIRNILEDDENYTPAEKRVIIDQLQGDMVRIARSVNEEGKQE